MVIDWSNHLGTYMRMAYATELRDGAPWTTFNPGQGVFSNTQVPFCEDTGSFAAPDVHVDDERQLFLM